jgi:deoxyribodipyrimidine photolyase
MINIHWFRKGLRLHDNISLKLALNEKNMILPMVIIDPWFINIDKVSINRMDMFL